MWAGACGAQGLDCKRQHTRIDKAICASPNLRQEDRSLDKAYADALARAPSKAQDLRKSQITWLGDRDAACATPDRKALTRCLEAQYRFRMQSLALMAPISPAPTSAAPGATAVPPKGAPPKPKMQPAVAPASAPPTAAHPAVAARQVPAPAVSPPPDDTIRPASYVSDAVVLRFGPDGRFEMKELSGSRQASGHYSYKAGVLTLLDATGDVGRTTFPLHCQVQRTVAGFAVSLGQPACRPLDGIAFRLAG